MVRRGFERQRNTRRLQPRHGPLTPMPVRGRGRGGRPAQEVDVWVWPSSSPCAPSHMPESSQRRVTRTSLPCCTSPPKRRSVSFKGLLFVLCSSLLSYTRVFTYSSGWLITFIVLPTPTHPAILLRTPLYNEQRTTPGIYLVHPQQMTGY